MSISSTGILVYGFDMGIEDEDPQFLSQDVERDFDDFIAHEAGVPDWRSGMSEDETKEYFAARRTAIKACPVDLVLHCSYDYPMWILAVRGTELTAPRGDPTIVKGWDVPQEKIDAAKKWCEAHRIVWVDPNWILCSIYG